MNFKKPFFIAEISANHEGSISKAYSLIKLAKKYGADAVKLQTYKPETMTLNSKKKYFKINNGLWKNYYLWDLYNKGHTPWSWHKRLFSYAKKNNIRLFSTPFDVTAVDFLEKLNCPFYKVSSFEMNDLELIKKISKTKKTIIISTGMASLREIDISFETTKRNGAKNIVLLYCVSSYPSKIDDYNMYNIKIMKERYKCDVGLSDHSNDSTVASLALCYGATFFEKHISINHKSKGLDSDFSLKGKDIAEYRNVLDTSFRLNDNKNFFFRSKNELRNKKFKRSIFSLKQINKNEKFTKFNIVKIRPGDGLDARYYSQILNRKSPIKISPESPLNKKLIKLLKLK